MTRSSEWMFEEWPEGTFLRESQVLATAWARLLAVMLRPLVPLVRRLP